MTATQKPRRQTRRQGGFGFGPASTPAEVAERIAELTDELERIEPTCNRCKGQGSSWWQNGTGACIRCGGSGSARKAAEEALAGLQLAAEFAASPEGRIQAYGRAHRSAVWGLAASDPARLDRAFYEVFCCSPENWPGRRAEWLDHTPTLRALFEAVAEGRQVGIFRAATAERILAEIEANKVARRAAARARGAIAA